MLPELFVEPPPTPIHKDSVISAYGHKTEIIEPALPGNPAGGSITFQPIALFKMEFFVASIANLLILIMFLSISLFVCLVNPEKVV